MKAPNQDLCVLKKLKQYEKCQIELQSNTKQVKPNLWYLSEEVAILLIFVETVDELTKENIIIDLQRESLYEFGKRYSCMVSIRFFLTLFLRHQL